MAEKKKKSGGGTRRKSHSMNRPVVDTPSINTTVQPRREESTNRTVTGIDVNAARPTGGRSHQMAKPKPVKKKTKRTKQRTLEETVDEGDDAQPSMLIEIPTNLLAKTSRSMMGRPVSEECSRQAPLHKAEALIETNQAFIDNTNRKGWQAIGQDFLREHKEVPGVNAMTRYTITFNVPPDTDFYDANKVEIPGVEPKFIIASAPTLEPESRENFWRMVYDSNVTNIYYLENQPECTDEPFIPWNANDGKDYGKMFVSNKKVTTTRRDAQAVLEVLPEGCSNSIIVRFAQSICWPDKVTIESEPRKSVLHLVRLLKDEKGQVLVICKSGLAKSCMFVMVHSLITLLNAKALRDPVDVLLKLRADRWGAIQNEQQYLMVYQALLDYIQVKTIAVKNCEVVKKKLFEHCKLYRKAE
ncbi:hypothetical protein PRIPAC_94999 [Pristionchus pacificus]|nr:hypothetical protein PRIPAC_94999 [Pristionchus pacificus]